MDSTAENLLNTAGIWESGIAAMPNSEFRIPNCLFRIPNSILSDTVRCAPVISAALSGQNDYFLQARESVRVRETKCGYFHFVINRPEDIETLTVDIRSFLRRFIAIDAEYEGAWRELFPEAEYRRFRLHVITRHMLSPRMDRSLPEDMQIVPMDNSWDELVVKLCADEEFTAEHLSEQLRCNLSRGLLWRGERAGFISTHLNGEIGPMWILPECRYRKFGAILLWEYLSEFFKTNKIVFGLSAPENHASAKMMENLGFQVLEKDILHITKRSVGANNAENVTGY